MQKNRFDLNTYSVVLAQRADIGEEWNQVKWNKHHFQIQYHRLYFLTKGKAELTLLNQKLDLTTGRVYFIPAFSIAESHIDGEMNKYYIHFQVDSPFFDVYPYVCNKFSTEAGPQTEYLFDTILNNYNDKSISAMQRVQGAMNLLMADFVDDTVLDKKSLLKFQPVLQYINEHYREPIPLDTLSRMMNISTMYFSNFFKKSFNISPKQFILNKRLSESQRLLLDTDLSVKEIAYSVGFENENYFSEFFTQKVGISAVKFRDRKLPTSLESIL